MAFVYIDLDLFQVFSVIFSMGPVFWTCVLLDVSLSLLRSFSLIRLSDHHLVLFFSLQLKSESWICRYACTCISICTCNQAFSMKRVFFFNAP